MLKKSMRRKEQRRHRMMISLQLTVPCHFLHLFLHLPLSISLPLFVLAYVSCTLLLSEFFFLHLPLSGSPFLFFISWLCLFSSITSEFFPSLVLPLSCPAGPFCFSLLLCSLSYLFLSLCFPTISVLSFSTQLSCSSSLSCLQHPVFLFPVPHLFPTSLSPSLCFSFLPLSCCMWVLSLAANLLLGFLMCINE